MSWPLALALAPHGAITIDDKLVFTAAGAPNATVQISVLRDCDADGVLDLKLSKAGCVSPVVTRALNLDAKGQGLGPVTLGDIPEVRAVWEAWSKAPATGPLQLGIMVGRTPAEGGGGEVGEVERVWFGGDACTPFAAIVAGYGATCQPDVSSLLFPPRTVASQVSGTFMVYRATPDSDDPSGRATSGTIGATGVTWEDAEHLLVTREAGSGLAAGLYRVDLEGEGGLVLAAPAGRTYTAPRLLGKDGLAVIERGGGGDTAVGFRKGKESWRVVLPDTVEALLGWDGTALIALSASPVYTLLRITPKTGLVEDLGWNASVYLSLQRGPQGLSAVSYRNDDEGYGWELALSDSNGKVIHDLRVGDGSSDKAVDDRVPTWRPGANEIAWVGEVR